MNNTCKMKSVILTLAIVLIMGIGASAQFVGDGGPATTPAPDKQKPSFTLKYGFALPSGNYGTAPSNGSTPKYKEGFMGAEKGFFAEAGLGINLTKPERKVAFYYYPFLIAYWKTDLNWSENSDAIFDKEEVYVKPVSGFEIAQRYGISFKPIDKMSIALYYRLGLIIPLDFEITAGNDFQFQGTSSTNEKAPSLVVSSAPGLSIRYSMFALSLEKYLVKPTYDITYNPSGPATSTTIMSKIPVNMTVLSLALIF